MKQGTFSTNKSSGTTATAELEASNGIVTDPPFSGAIGRDFPPGAVDVPDSFCIECEASANWLIRKIRECRDYAARVEGWAASEIRRTNAEERRLLERFESQLEQWARRRLTEKGSRSRTVHLPAGAVSLRRKPARLEVVDPARLLAWCRDYLRDALQVTVHASGVDAFRVLAWQREHCPDVRVSEAVAKSVVNAYVAETAEIPDGTQLREPVDRLFVG
jgi:hypothetical protein